MSVEEEEYYEHESFSSKSENPLGLYDGERNESGQRHGYGKTVLPNGDIYEGNYCNGNRHGRGLYAFKANGSRYDGDWRLNVKHGRGTFFYPDGTRYVGEWKRGVRHGHGIYRYRNGDTYEGNWKQGWRHGLGTYTWSSTGSKFYGTWIYDRMHGIGRLMHVSGQRFHGTWDVNLPLGKGCYVYDNTKMQHGYYELVRRTNDNESDRMADYRQKEEDAEDDNEDAVVITTERDQRPAPIRRGYTSLWRASCVTDYKPELLPGDPRPFEDEVSEKSVGDSCEYNQPDDGAEIYLKKEVDSSIESEYEEGESFVDGDENRT